MALSLNLSSQLLQYQKGGTVPSAQSIIIYFGGHISNQYPDYTNKKVKCIETGEIFDSIVQVGKKHNQCASNVSRYYIDGKRKLGGYTYEKIN